VLTVMTTEEARSRIGCAVLYSDGSAEPEEVVIDWVGSFLAYVRWPCSGEHKAVPPRALTPAAGEAPGAAGKRHYAAGDRLTASQARLNEFAAGLIRSVPGNRAMAELALSALREHNWAYGFTFDGAREPYGMRPAAYRETALLKTEVLELEQRAGAAGARAAAAGLKDSRPPEAWAMARRPGYRANGPALVYLVTHPSLGAAKVGVSDAAGERIAVHRRAGWQLLAAFQVAADAAAAIEADVLRWWRGDLGLPAYLSRDQMPQGGSTETVAACRVDLAATVARLCELALRPGSRPAAAA
jgi:hypothetical protein